MQHLEPQVFASLWVASGVLLIVVFGAIVQAGLGMGFGLTVAPLLALIDPVLVPVPALFLGAATSLVGALAERSNIIWKEVGYGTVGRLIGTIFGVLALLQLTSQSTFSLVFGIVILFAVALSFAGWQLALTMRNLLAMGFVSGFTGVITSVGAPPLALIYQHRPSTETRPTLAAFFALGCMVSLAMLFASGLAGMTHFWLACFMAPAAVVGTIIGRKLRGRFDSRYRHFLLAIAAVASILLIVKGLAG